MLLTYIKDRYFWYNIMNLAEEYDVNGELKYHYLIPDDAQEAAIFVKMAELYPKYFDIYIEKKMYGRYEIRLGILKA